MIDPPQVTQASARLTAVIRLTIPREEIRNVMGPGNFYFEVGVPVAAPVAAAGPESGPDPATWRTELNRPLIG